MCSVCVWCAKVCGKGVCVAVAQVAVKGMAGSMQRWVYVVCVCSKGGGGGKVVGVYKVWQVWEEEGVCGRQAGRQCGRQRWCCGGWAVGEVGLFASGGGGSGSSLGSKHPPVPNATKTRPDQEE